MSIFYFSICSCTAIARNSSTPPIFFSLDFVHLFHVPLHFVLIFCLISLQNKVIFFSFIISPIFPLVSAQISRYCCCFRLMLALNPGLPPPPLPSQLWFWLCRARKTKRVHFSEEECDTSTAHAIVGTRPTKRSFIGWADANRGHTRPRNDWLFAFGSKGSTRSYHP